MEQIKDKKKEESIVLSTKVVNEILQKENLGLKLKNTEKLWFKNIKGVRKPNVTFSLTNDEVSEYFKCKMDIKYFVENYVNIKREDGTIGRINLRDYQNEMIDIIDQNRFSIFMFSRQSGKAQDLDSLVWTKNGKYKFGDLKIGDDIYDESGELTTVVGVYPQGIKDIYEIEFSDGVKVRSCSEHLWEVIKNKKTKIVQLSEIMDSYLTNRGDSIYYVKMNKPVNYPEKELPLDPYFLGLILGDGSTRNNRLTISSMDKEVIDYLYTLEDDDIEIKIDNTCDYKIIKRIKKNTNRHKIISTLRSLDLMEKYSYEKHIPEIYLYGSIEQRLNLLQGLMDTDGSCSKNCVTYTTTSKQLSNNFRELCHSLGIRTDISERITSYTYNRIKKQGRKSYTIRLLIKNGFEYNIFRIKRKQDKISTNIKKYDWGTKRGIVNITHIGKKEAQCIEVNNDSHLYLTDNYIPTHNTIGTSIMILHTVLFSNDKNVLIVGNNGVTVSENIKKIKDIYLLLPYFLKKGAFNWAEKTISLDNGSRIKTANCTATAGIGNAVDFLYLDEFAKIPSNISRAYYGAVVPTVSSINNSKIVITSTPDGFNLFHDLLIDSERDEEDPLKNMYKSLRVYWHQIKGRMDVKMLPLVYKLKTYNLTLDEVLDELKDIGYELYTKDIDNKTYHYIKYDMDDDKTSIAEVRNLRVKNIPLQELFIITNWKEDETKLIGGENMFNQEYDLQFVTGDKLLFDSEQMTKFKMDSVSFKYIQFSKLDKQLTIPYTQLKWIQGRPDIFDVNKMKDYHICAAIDLSEGLGQDYTILNIFRILPKSKELIEKTNLKLSNVYEYFYLEQIGMCRVNNWNMNEFAELFYMVMFELFDPEKSKVVLEYNTYGATLLSELTKIFDGEHNYSNGIFLRYKHRKDDTNQKIGMKITGGENEASKKLLIKSLQSAVKKQLIKLHNDTNINEISVFTKKQTASGNFTYQCESGHDDCLLPDTWIKTITCYKKIKDIKIGDLVLTHLGNYKQVKNICIKNFDGDMYNVKFKGQSSLDITYNHPIYTNVYSKNKKIYDSKIWETPDNLIVKKHKSISIIEKYIDNDLKLVDYTELFDRHKLMSEKNVKLKNIKFDKTFAKFLGLFLADGNCYKPNKTSYIISIAFNVNQTLLITEIKNYLSSIGLKYYGRFQNDNGYTLMIYNKTLYELLINCYDKETKEKVLPDFAYSLGKDLKYVLEYWLKGDGWFKKSKNNRKEVNIGCSTSLQLALSMRDISLSIGKHALITKNKRHRYGKICKDQYWVTIYDESPKGSSLKKISDFEISSSLDYSKKYHYSGITYNLEVEDDNSYVANGIVVHNCMMSLVSLSSVYEHVQYKNLIDNIIDKYLTIFEKSTLETYAYNKPSEDKINYESTKNMHNRIYKGNGFGKQQGVIPWKSSPWGKRYQ